MQENEREEIITLIPDSDACDIPDSEVDDLASSERVIVDDGVSNDDEKVVAHQETVNLEDPVLKHILSLCLEIEEEEILLVCQAVCSKSQGCEHVLSVETICNTYGRLPSARKSIGPAKPTAQEGRWRNRSKLYKYMQAKYSSDKRQLSTEILDNIDAPETKAQPTPEAIVHHNRAIFSSDSPEDENPAYDIVSSPCEIYAPIKRDNGSHQKYGPDDWGPDEMDSLKLSRIPLQVLEMLVNLIIYSSYAPRPLPRSRTVLIPKSSNNLENVEN